MNHLDYEDNRSQNKFPKNKTLLENLTKDEEVTSSKLRSMLKKALAEDCKITFKVLFYVRDPRCGYGKRQAFKDSIMLIAKYYKDYRYNLLDNLENVPKFGRWDDLFVLFNTPLEGDVLDLIQHTLYKGESRSRTLLIKWLPREKSANKKIAKKIAKHLKLSLKDYRKMLSKETNVVENYMCSNDWGSIDLERVSFQALNKYKMAFNKRYPEKYNKVLEGRVLFDKDDFLYIFTLKELEENKRYSIVK